VVSRTLATTKTILCMCVEGGNGWEGSSSQRLKQITSPVLTGFDEKVELRGQEIKDGICTLYTSRRIFRRVFSRVGLTTFVAQKTRSPGWYKER